MIKRLVDLLVKSVDLVDIPANQRPFILVKNKNQQEAEMSMQDAEKDRAIEAAVADAGGDKSSQQDKGEATQVEKQEAKPAIDTKPVEKQQEAQQEPELPEEVQKAMADADAIFAEDEALTQAKELLTQITEKALDPSKAGAAIGQAITMLEGAAKMPGMPNGAKLAIGRALGLLSKVKGYAAPGGAAMAKAGYKKPEDTMKDVEKAGAAMSKTRMEQLEQALANLTKAGEQLKTLFEGVSNAKGKKDVMKDKDGAEVDVNKALSDANETIKTLNERIAKIEGTVTVSKAAEGGDGEGDKAGKVVEKSFWSGVI